ncbi:MAG TPA: hypothetical protein VIV15_06855 [Anaerolineales bacterium]
MRFVTARLLFLMPLILCLVFAAPTPVAAEDTCANPVMVMVDVKPGSEANKVNLAAHGVLPVAVLGTPEFDASLFAPEMAHLSDAATAEGCAGARAVRWSRQDVNSDGRQDILFFFRTQELNFSSNTTAAMLMAHGMYQGVMIHIHGMDKVKIKP